jgi:hypothetical protein
LDLMTFFDLFHSKKLDEAIDIIAKIKVIWKNLIKSFGNFLAAQTKF